jgi:hypothetical protein
MIHAGTPLKHLIETRIKVTKINKPNAKLYIICRVNNAYKYYAIACMHF